jgi:hypothetical protein
MSLFEINVEEKTIKEIKETEFSTHGIYERSDIQEWIEKNTDIFEEPILIVAKEFGAFDKTNERADLVGLDQEGKIVIIELKRDDTGANVHWQAVKYASYFRKVSSEDIVKIHSQYHNKTIEESTKIIIEFLKTDDLSRINFRQRIILVSHRFALEVTSAVLWLNENGIDVKCIEIIPYQINTQLYLQSQVIIPVLGTDNFEISASVAGQEVTINRKSNENRNDSISNYMREVREKALEKLLDPSLKPENRSRHAGIYDYGRYYKLWFNELPWDNHNFSYQMHVGNDPSSKDFFCVGFHFRKDWATANGFSSKKVEDLIAGLSKLQISDTQLSSDSNEVSLIRYFDKAGYENIDIVTDFLSQLIKDVTEEIKKLT